MQLTPRYDGPDLLRIDAATAVDPSVPLLRQRRRLAEVLAGLDDEQWSAPSRCSAWTVRDVIAHLVDTDRFWTFSIGAARAGEPTRFLATFDPVATPVQLVDAMAERSAEEVLAMYRDGIDGLAAAVDGLDAAGWEIPGEAPPGHVPLRALALHALWDGWVHERDITLPLGLEPVVDAEEQGACLAYAAGLGPAFLAAGGSEREGVLVVAPTDGPAVRVTAGATVTVGPDTGAEAGGEGEIVLRGTGVELIEALSFRGPLPHPVAEGDRWILTGLATVFEADAVP